MTTYAPPPAPPAAPPRRTGGWVATVVTLIGVALILMLVAGAVLRAVWIPRWDEQSHAVDVQGVTAVDIGISAAELTVEFDPAATQATLHVSAGNSGRDREWDLSVRNNVLRLSDSRGPWFLPSWGWNSDRVRGHLTLPASLEGTIDADLELNAGSMTVLGDLANVDIKVSAGSFTFDGDSTALDVEVNAGEANVTTSGPETVDVQVSAGQVRATVTGAAPTSTTVEVNAGRADLWLPEGDYNVRGSASVGERVINVRTDPASSNRLDVDVNAGRAEVGYSN